MPDYDNTTDKRNGPHRTFTPRGSFADRAGITDGPLSKAILKLAAPLVLGGMFINTFSLVDMFFVGKLGDAAVAAVAVSGAWVAVTIMLISGVGVGCASLVSIAVGNRDSTRAGLVAGQSILAAVILAGVVAIAGWPLAPKMLALLTPDAHVVSNGMSYLRIAFISSFSFFLPVTFGSTLRGSGDTVTPTLIMAAANVINIILDPLLIFGIGPFPEMGVAGSALATAIARSLGMIFLGYRLFFGHSHRVTLSLSSLRPHLKMIALLFKIGIFASAQMLARNISGIFMMWIVSQFGTMAQAAYGIGFRLWQLMLFMGFNFGMASGIIVGQNLGAGKPDRAERAGWLATGFFGLVTVVGGIVFLVFNRQLIGIFRDSPEVVRMGADMLRWTTYVLPFFAMSIVLSRSLNGAGDTFWAMMMTIFSLFALRIPLAIYLSSAWNSVDGVWVALAASQVAQGTLTAIVFKIGHWKTVGLRHRDADIGPGFQKPVAAEAVPGAVSVNADIGDEFGGE